MLDRIIRVWVAAMLNAKDEAGSMIERRKGTTPSAMFVVSGIVGNQPKCKAKNMIKTKPNQNLGSDTPIVARAVATESKTPLCFRAANIPKGSETTSAITMALPAA